MNKKRNRKQELLHSGGRTLRHKGFRDRDTAKATETNGAPRRTEQQTSCVRVLHWEVTTPASNEMRIVIDKRGYMLHWREKERERESTVRE